MKNIYQKTRRITLRLFDPCRTRNFGCLQNWMTFGRSNVYGRYGQIKFTLILNLLLSAKSSEDYGRFIEKRRLKLSPNFFTNYRRDVMKYTVKRAGAFLHHGNMKK